jgi:methyltransferase (TIGR00027 family)
MQADSWAALGRRAFLFAGAILPPLAKSVEPGMGSRTAIGVAAGRAIASRDPNSETRCPDSMAGRLIQHEDLALLTGSSTPALYDLPWDEVLRRESAAGRYPYLNLTLRTMHIDAKVRAAAAEGLDELVILGAGLDSRAYRMTEELAKTRVFEVDFPPTQEDKKRRVKTALGKVPGNVTYVGIDFAKQTLDEVLLAVGHRPSAKALFLMEGVTMYLAAEAVSSTLQFVSKNSAPGGGIVFDYYDRRLLDGEGQTPFYKATTDLVRTWGEPQIFGIPGYDSRRFVEQHGLRLRSDYTFGELCLLHTPRLNPALLDYRRLYYRVGHAVVA